MSFWIDDWREGMEEEGENEERGGKKTVEDLGLEDEVWDDYVIWESIFDCFDYQAFVVLKDALSMWS